MHKYFLRYIITNFHEIFMAKYAPSSFHKFPITAGNNNPVHQMTKSMNSQAWKRMQSTKHYKDSQMSIGSRKRSCAESCRGVQGEWEYCRLYLEQATRVFESWECKQGYFIIGKGNMDRRKSPTNMNWKKIQQSS